VSSGVRSEVQPRRRFEGPLCWLVSAVVGLLLGAGLSRLVPAVYSPDPVVPLWLCIPFALLLLLIAVMPFIHQHFWHHHFPDVAFFLGSLVGGYYLDGFSAPAPGESHGYGGHAMLHALVEYYSFIALVGGLFVVSGGILVEVNARGRPLVNVCLLALGAVLANIVGTTGASMLLIRPFIRVNEGRLRPIHVVFFIFIVSNCAGCLTPVGDPPLYLGYLKGVPFFWTLEHLWIDWLIVVGLLLGVYWVVDSRIPVTPMCVTEPSDTPPPPAIRVTGSTGLFCLVLMIAGVFIDPALKHYAAIEGLPIGATFQLCVAAAAYTLAPREILAANTFSFFPVKEVGLLFVGIFATMVPALGYLGLHGAQLGITKPSVFYLATGTLSAVLDNAPTYVNFLQIALGPHEMTSAGVRAWLAQPGSDQTLHAISTGAVFFGAMTYIGNGPNFMVKAIAETAHVRMPSFFAYLGLAVSILLPVLLVNWVIGFVIR